MLIIFDMLCITGQRYRNKLEFYYNVYPLYNHFCDTITNICENVKGLRYDIPYFLRFKLGDLKLKYFSAYMAKEVGT